jgi:chemotaxis protein CheC
MSSIHFDILKEIGNIGSGNAVTALAKLTGKKVDMQVPKVKILEFKQVSSVLGNPEDLVFGILVNFSGDIKGIMMFIMQLDSARALIDNMIGFMTGSSNTRNLQFTEIDLSALEEIGNIMASSYLGALGGLIGKRVVPSVPSLAKDMAAAILSVPAIAFGSYADHVLFIESVFGGDESDGSNSKQTGYFILVPELDSFNEILKSLGVM